MAIAKILDLERLLLPEGCHFAEDARDVIDCWESADIQACPGSGKTTVLMAKLQYLAGQMPFPQGRGVCILSHTNVAVNEIKRRLTGDAAARILAYPNFAGTIQSFVDSFVVLPFWRSRTRSTIRLVSQEEFAKAAWERVGWNRTYRELKTFVSGRYSCSRGRFKSEIKLMEDLYLDDQRNLRLGKEVVARATTASAKEYGTLVLNLLLKDGLMSYELAFNYANAVLNKHENLIRPVLAQRFQYVFIDEYQDCSDVQRRLLSRLFDGTDTVVQRIGDRDQAIYNSIYSSLGSEWNAAGRCLEIAETNRYGDEIARVVSKLRSGSSPIVSQRGAQNRKPILFVYGEGKEKNVTQAFVHEIKEHNLKTDGTFKAIGMVARGKGTKIGDYWDSFADDVISTSKDGWVYYRQEIVRQLGVGRLYKVAQMIDELLVLASRCRNLRTEGGGAFTKSQVRKIIEQKVDDDYRGGILQLASACARESDKAEYHILSLLISLCPRVFGGEWTEESLLHDLSAAGVSEARRLPIPFSDNSGISVSLSTIHGAKGETHDATLYLETEHNRGSDLKRIMPLFAGKALSGKEIEERSRRCAYVGMSRPRHLLCVAMKAKTYEGHERCFESDWKVVKIQ